jgi:hypothetical protein
VLVFSGGNSPTTAERFPRGEAVHYAEHAIARGVPRDAFIITIRKAWPEAAPVCVGASAYLCGTGLDQAPFAALGLSVAMLSAAIREHARLSSDAWNSQQAESPDPRMAESA